MSDLGSSQSREGSSSFFQPLKAVLFGFTFGIVLLTIFLVALFWQNGWIAAIGGLALAYFAIGIIAAVKLRGVVIHHPRLFPTTMAELGKDRDYLRASTREQSSR